MGRVEHPRTKGRRNTEVDASAGQAGEFYRLIIPTNNLAIMAELMPDVQIMEISGAGSFSKAGVSAEFKWGKYTQSISGILNINWVYDAQSGVAKLKTIYEDCQKAGFGDVAIQRLVYLKNLGTVKHSWDNAKIPQNIRFVFKSESIHPSTYQAIMADGYQPMAEMYTTLRRFRESIILPENLRISGLRPTYLKLLNFQPPTATGLMADYFAMQAIREKGMFVMKDVGRASKVRDMVTEQ